MWLLILIISAVSYGLSQTEFAYQHGFGALPIAIALGVLLSNIFNIRVTNKSNQTLTFCKNRLLRLGIILFGSHLTITQLVAIGWRPILIDSIVVSTILFLGIWAGLKIFKLTPEEAILTSVGSAVCGAAAILATEPVLKANQQQVSISVATVVIFGTLALFCYPIIFHWTALEPSNFGVYIGSTVHEVAQAVAAGQTISPEAMQTAIIVKLIRVMLLAPVVISLSIVYQKLNQSSREQTIRLSTIPWPWFVLGFIATVLICSTNILPTNIIHIAQTLAQLLLIFAMAALGLQTKLVAFRQAGIKPLALSAMLFFTLIIGGYFLNVLIM